MAVVFHQYVSLYSFIMGVLWFSVFVLLGLLIRKLKFPIKFSVVPLLLLLVLSVLRMFVVVEMPRSVIILSETIYPAIISVLRYEIIAYRLFGLPINAISIFVVIWIIGTIWLTVRYVREYAGTYRPMAKWLSSYDRDESAESLLSNSIGHDKHFHIYKNDCCSTAKAMDFNPYIILPEEVDFSPDELRVILRHEWKHIRDKDYLIKIMVNLVCFLFWWNPMVYILRRNFSFATELKCDQFAVSNKQDAMHFLKGLALLQAYEKSKANKRMAHKVTNSFIGSSEADRFEVLVRRGYSRKKRILSNVCYSIIILGLFFASYAFTILPIFWESPDIPVSAEDFMGEYREGGGIFRPGEIIAVDNGDGTFSVYADGLFVKYIDATHEVFATLTVFARESD